MVKLLSELIASIPGALLEGDGGVEISGVRDDSRKVGKDDLFIAIRGFTADGHRYIPAALSQGASAIAGELSLSQAQEMVGGPLGVPYVQVRDGREALAYLAAAWHGFPARKLGVIGVTGTDGKTTTTTLITSILEAAKHPAGMVTSVEAAMGGSRKPTGFHVTTPEALDVQRYLAEMVEAGMEYAVLESTSHGLSQHRVTACDFDVAVVTNITHEHLDIHGTFDAYRDAKAMLFRHLGTAYHKGIPKVAVLNADDEASFDYLRAIPAEVQLTYGVDSDADLVAREIRHLPSGLSFVARTLAGDMAIESPLVGRFNVSNILAALAVAISRDVPTEAIQAGVKAMRGVRGRMEPIDLGQDFTVIVDFAHTPNALRRALEAVRTLTQGRVIAIFGCAGLRDVGKRPLMGEVSCRLADVTVMTAEDPRTESLEEILDQMAEGCHHAGGRQGIEYLRIPDRGEAIQTAIDMAWPGDLVIMAGKGHEQSMCFGTTEHPWSDHETAENALRKRLGLEVES